MIQTVLGPIAAADFGFALPHEHVMCDFIGADKTGRGRWDVNEVAVAILPLLRQARERGVRGFVDCTPAYIGRDPRVLKLLAERSGLHIVTNTGYYGGMNDKFVPTHAFTESAEQLAARWVSEWQDGIEESGVRPGFIKIGVDEVPQGVARLSDVDEKLVRASAIASRESGLAVTCHTGGASGGLAAAQLFLAEKGEPSRFIVAHSDGHGREANLKIAEFGCWISFDGIGYQPVEKHVQMVRPMLEQHADQVLLSMDKGWWWVGEEKGGKIESYNFLPDVFLPALRQSGVDEEMIARLTRTNPARAFALPA
jgi:predicted metal-dependent phosphotriesterase family hydrolase